jgi:hypothetical protein
MFLLHLAVSNRLSWEILRFLRRLLRRLRLLGRDSLLASISAKIELMHNSNKFINILDQRHLHRTIKNPGKPNTYYAKNGLEATILMLERSKTARASDLTCTRNGLRLIYTSYIWDITVLLLVIYRIETD